jgi:hypothetical protein
LQSYCVLLANCVKISVLTLPLRTVFQNTCPFFFFFNLLK